MKLIAAFAVFALCTAVPVVKNTMFLQDTDVTISVPDDHFHVTTYTPCRTCAAGQYQTRACEASRDAECANCSPACGTEQYESRACGGSLDRQCSACTTCGTNQYQTTACTPNQNRVCSACAVCGGDEYVTRACSGTQNRQCTACTTCTGDQYETQACADTQDRMCSACTTCTGDNYETQACTSTQNRVCSACTTCTGDNYETQACTSTQNRVCSACTTCTGDNYETQACTSTQNRVCSACTTCTGDNYETQACTSTQNRVCSACHACGTNEYETTACSGTQDRVCSACASCGTGQYETTACSGTQNRVCSACASCGTGQYETTACTATQNRVCSACTACGTNEYETTACSGSQNRVCSACDAACGVGETESTACTTTSNRVCTACTSKPNNSVYTTAGSCAYSCNTGFTLTGTECVQDQADGGEADGSIRAVVLGREVNHQDTTSGRIDASGFTAPVVFVSPVSWHGGHEAVARISRNGDRFRLFVLEPKCKDYWHTTERLSYLILEDGSQSSDHNVRVVDSTSSWVTRDPDNESTLGTRPHVFQMIQSNGNGADHDSESSNKYRGYVKTRMQIKKTGSPSKGRMQLQIEGSEKQSQSGLASEQVGLLFFKSGCAESQAPESDSDSWCGCSKSSHSSCLVRTGTFMGKKYEVGFAWAKSDFGANGQSTITYQQSFTSQPTLLVNMQTERGGNPAEVRLINQSATSFKYQLDEDSCKDSESKHISEWVSYLAIEA